MEIGDVDGVNKRLGYVSVLLKFRNIGGYDI
jgi:hypothetical protein